MNRSLAWAHLDDWNGREKSDAQLPLDRSSAFPRQSTASNGQEIGKSHKRKAPTKAARERFRVVAVSTRVGCWCRGLAISDNSNLSVSPKSSVRLDKFVYDPNKSSGGVAVEATRGSFRFVTGSQSRGSYQVKDPLRHPWNTRLRNCQRGSLVELLAGRDKPKL